MAEEKHFFLQGEPNMRKAETLPEDDLAVSLRV